MFVTDDAFRQHVADSFKMDVADLAAYWDRFCQAAHLSAFKDIRGALLTRGFTASQIDSWDRGEEFEKDIGLFWCCIRGVGAKSLDQESLDRLDRRTELLTVHVEVSSGAPQVPAKDPGRISSGTMSVLDTDGTLTDAGAPTWTRDTPL